MDKTTYKVSFGKAEMIEGIETLIKANKDNDNCSVFWLADMIKEVIQEVNDE